MSLYAYRFFHFYDFWKNNKEAAVSLVRYLEKMANRQEESNDFFISMYGDTFVLQLVEDMYGKAELAFYTFGNNEGNISGFIVEQIPDEYVEPFRAFYHKGEWRTRSQTSTEDMEFINELQTLLEMYELLPGKSTLYSKKVVE